MESRGALFLRMRRMARLDMQVNNGPHWLNETPGK